MPIVEQLAPRVPGLRGVIVLTDRAHMPAASGVRTLLCYEELLAAEAPPADIHAFQWPAIDENAPAGLCFTSGTTGNPKGVQYSHRSQVLHAMTVVQPDLMGLSSSDVLCVIVPIFHANGWSTLSATLITGTRLVLPGPRLDGPSIHTLMEAEGATVSAAVPTVWMGLLTHLQSTPGAALSTLNRVVIGGAAVPPSMLRTFEVDYGVRVCHAYGLTECSPMLTLNVAKGGVPRTDAQKQKQGRAMFTVELRIVDDAGAELPWDGVATGNLQSRGPAVLKRYYKNAGGDVLQAGWFDTGDVASIDVDGFVCISDRRKDIIKSGGEWISSQDVEGTAMGFAPLAAAACIGVADEKWGERPLLVCVRKPGARCTEAEVLDYLRPRIAKWWLPDRVVFVDAIPMTATGKFDKKVMRQQHEAAARSKL